MHSQLTLALRSLAALAAALAFGMAGAEKADRSRPIVLESDRPSTMDLQRQVSVLSGNATISQGTMVIRADRIELRELPSGFRAASAIGTAARPASYRQKRDGVEEYVEGVADRIEYDERANTLKFIGNGAVRRLRGSTVADEITGAQITWDATGEVFSVEGGAASAANPGGRVRAVLSPRAEPAASEPPAPLQPNRSLGR